MNYYEHLPAPSDLIYSDLTISKHQYELIGNAWLTLAPYSFLYISTFNGLASSKGTCLCIVSTRSCQKGA